MPDLLCDFCSAPAPEWRHPAYTFATDIVPGVTSVGHWAACNVCHEMIETGRRADLAQRCVQTLILAMPEANVRANEITVQVLGLHRQFFEHRAGPAVRMGGAVQ